jgi:sRNA-binding protein
MSEQLESSVADSPAAKAKPDPRALLQSLADLLPPGVIVAERGRPGRPLKLGIHIDLINAGLLTPPECRAVFRLYTHTRPYLLGLIAGAPRIGIDGQPCGVVTESEAARAAAELARMDERQAKEVAAWSARRDAQRAAAAERKGAREAAQKATDVPAHREAPPTAIAAAPPAPAVKAAAVRRMSLADLKAAAAARRAAQAVLSAHPKST